MVCGADQFNGYVLLFLLPISLPTSFSLQGRMDNSDNNRSRMTTKTTTILLHSRNGANEPTSSSNDKTIHHSLELCTLPLIKHLLDNNINKNNNFIACIFALPRMEARGKRRKTEEERSKDQKMSL